MDATSRHNQAAGVGGSRKAEAGAPSSSDVVMIRPTKPSLQQGVDAMDQNRLEDALKVFDAVRMNDPLSNESEQATAYMILCYQSLNQQDKLKQTLEEFARDFPHSTLLQDLDFTAGN
jgi:outer membrane protein assembly factor BamD (BamD/ComL family)